MSIYIVSHKEYEFPNLDYYLPIQVGSIFNDNYLSDNSFENISQKNKNYCELTALFWIWKNTKDDIVGLVHYRRYFVKKSIFSFKFNDIRIPKETQIKKILKKNEIILPKKDKAEPNVYKHWSKYHYIKDWDGIGKIIKKHYPEYLSSYYNISKNDRLYTCNMFITKRKILNDYCEWLFDILFKYENIANIYDYNSYQSRLFGFLSERLLNIWIEHHRPRIKHLKKSNIEE